MYLLGVALGFFQMFLNGFIAYKEANKKSPVVFLWATLFVMFGVPHFVAVIAGDLIYDDLVLFDASFFAICFMLLYLLARSQSKVAFITLNNEGMLFKENTKVVGTSFEMFCFIVFLTAIIGYMWGRVSDSGGLLNTAWGSLRNVEHSYVGVEGLFSRFLLMFSGFSLYFFITKRKLKAMFVLLLFVMLIIITRNRVQMLPLFIFFVSLWLIKIKEINYKYCIIGILAGCVIVYIVYAVRAFRWLGTLERAIDIFSWTYINDTVLSFINDDNGELGLRRDFYYFIANDNNFEGFNQGISLLRILLVYIPSRWSFGLKPQSFDLYMGQAVGMTTGGSTHPTLFGDCFGNLYWFGILLGILWAFIANFLDYMITKQKDDFFKIMIFFLASYSFVVIGRGSVSNGFDPTAWGILFLTLIKYFFLRLQNVNVVIGSSKNNKLLHTK